MEASVAALLLITTSIVLACIVITYAVNITTATVDPDNSLLTSLNSTIGEVFDEAFASLNQTAPPTPAVP